MQLEQPLITEDITYIKADKKEVEEAKKQSISLGRYKAQESISVDQETKTNISKAPVKEITALIKDKENVIQWDAKDDKAIDVPAVDTKPEVKSDNGATSTEPDKNANRDKPIVNIPSENGNSNIDKDTGKGTIAKPITNDVLEVEPEAPPVKEQEKNTKPAG